jgi:hypothetical protein
MPFGGRADGKKERKERRKREKLFLAVVEKMLFLETS